MRGIADAGRNWMFVAETLPSLLVVPETMTVEPIETSLIAPLTLLETVVAGVMRTTCELPSRVSSVMLPESAAATVPLKMPPAVAPPRAPV